MIRAIHLKTEYLVNPVGIDIPEPRLFWTVDGAKRQTACQVTASIDYFRRAAVHFFRNFGNLAILKGNLQRFSPGKASFSIGNLIFV